MAPVPRMSPTRPIPEPIFKRPFDLAAAGVALLVTMPLWSALALAIRLEDGGPIFFRQARIGRGGALFPLLKFRSMIVDPGSVEVQARSEDPRITRVGQFMRRTGLDELPQLWNIFAGHMSFVGPRPQPEKELVLIRGVEREVIIRQVPGHGLRMLVRPGLTGIAQIHAPRVVEHRNKFRYDALYIKRLLATTRGRDAAGILRRLRAHVEVFLFDVGLIVRSVWMGLTGRLDV
jgi:lipopolysaccharide/colanic/teichoic acid biosynthesis glycosyltransferase